MGDARRNGNARIDDIEVLRAFAVGLVLIQHMPVNLVPFAPQHAHLGFWSGVDLFFAVSGFVIARSLLPLLPPTNDRRAYIRTTLSFWTRRALRLLPSAWLWLAVTVTASAVFNQSGAFGPFRANVSGAVAAILYYANFHEAFGFGRFSLGAVFHYWSLSLEEQFYLALPLVIFLARGRLPTVLIAIVASQFFIRRVGPWGDLLFAHIRCDALSLGVLLAIWSQSAAYRHAEPTALSSPLSRWLLPPALALLLAMVAGPMLGLPRCTMALVAFVAAGIVWIASYNRDYLIPPGRVKRVLCWIGARSYAIYLIHVPAYAATVELWTHLRPSVTRPGLHHAPMLIATALPLILALAELNFRFVESPLRAYGARFAERIRLGKAATDETLTRAPA